MNIKQIILTLVLMLLSGLAGGFVYQKFFIPQTQSTTTKLAVTESATDRNKSTQIQNRVDLTRLLARNLEGKAVNLAEYQDKHLIINFWATWCPPCRREIPLLIAAQTQYQSQDVQVIGIAMDDSVKVKHYMEKVNFNYPSLITDLNQTVRFAQELNYQFNALPFTFFIHKDGNIQKVKSGELKHADFEKRIMALLH